MEDNFFFFFFFSLSHWTYVFQCNSNMLAETKWTLRQLSDKVRKITYWKSNHVFYIHITERESEMVLLYKEPSAQPSPPTSLQTFEIPKTKWWSWELPISCFAVSFFFLFSIQHLKKLVRNILRLKLSIFICISFFPIFLSY